MNTRLLDKFRTNNGFTLVELLVVIAVVGVITAIAIPVFNNAMEKSREAVDLENIRTAYLEVSTLLLLDEYTEDKAITVTLQQQEPGWKTQVAETYFASIGIVDGKPLKDGACTVLWDPEQGKIVFSYSGHYKIESNNGVYLETVAAGLVKDFKEIIPEYKREQAESCLNRYSYTSSRTGKVVTVKELIINPTKMGHGCYWDPNMHTWGEVLAEAGIDVSKIEGLGDTNNYIYFDADLNPISMSYRNEDGKYCYTYLDNGETFKMNNPDGERATPAYDREYAKSKAIK